MRKRGIAAVICLMVLLVLFPWLWFRSQGDDQPVEAVFYEGGGRLDTSVRMCHGDDPVFAASLDDFIRCFNGHFEQETGQPYFPEANRWQSMSFPRGIHSPYPTRQYCFSEDEMVYSLPTVTVYTTMEDHSILEITLNYDEHSYTPIGFQRFCQLCSCALRVFFLELTEEEACDLVDRIISFGSDNVFGSDQQYDVGAIPPGLFCKNGVGIYPYFAIGGWERLCIIPVTAERLQAFEQKGVILYEVE